MNFEEMCRDNARPVCKFQLGGGQKAAYCLGKVPRMTDVSKFKPKTTYVSYIAATPEQVWQALTDPVFTRRYFAGFAVDVEPRRGGAFRVLYPDGRVHISGKVVEWSPPRRLICTGGRRDGRVRRTARMPGRL